MTIVAASIEARRILLVADCRVTFADGTRHDALQKVYPLGPNAIVAIAGSVQLASSALREMATSKVRTRKVKLDVIIRRLLRITDRKAQHLWEAGRQGADCSYIIAGYVGTAPYLATMTIRGGSAPRVQIMRKAGANSVIGSGEAERDSCRRTIAGAGLETFTDEQAAWALSGFIDAGLALLSAPQRFDEGIGDLKLHFVLDDTGWRFIPQHTGLS